jgi:nucleotide-binding universal stress UspA family protein
VRPTTFFGSGGPVFVTSLEEVHAARAVAVETAIAACAAGVKAHPHDVEGDDADVIVRVATELEVEMIVVGCRDEAAVRAGHAGSVSRTLAATSPVPVTVVRADR